MPSEHRCWLYCSQACSKAERHGRSTAYSMVTRKQSKSPCVSLAGYSCLRSVWVRTLLDSSVHTWVGSSLFSCCPTCQSSLETPSFTDTPGCELLFSAPGYGRTLSGNSAMQKTFTVCQASFWVLGQQEIDVCQRIFFPELRDKGHDEYTYQVIR